MIFSRLFISRNFGLLWTGQATSAFGDAVIEVILPVWMASLTGSPTMVAVVAGLQVLPTVLFGPLAGVFADRWDSRRTMLVCDLLRGLIVASLLVFSAAQMSGAIPIVSFLMAFVSLFFVPARSICVRECVPDGSVNRAWAQIRSTESLALVLGPVVGAGLLAIGAYWGVLFDAATFMTAAAATWLISTSRIAARAERESSGEVSPHFGRELAEGIAHTLRNRELVLVFIASAVFSLVEFVWFSVDAFFVVKSLNMPTEIVGVLWAFSGVGGVAGSVLLAARVKPRQSYFALALGVAVKGGAMIWYSQCTSLPWAIAAATVSGVSGVLITVSMMAILVEKTDQSILGRVTALFEFTAHAATLVGIILIAFVATRDNPAEILFGFGMLMLAANIVVAPLWISRLPRWRG